MRLAEVRELIRLQPPELDPVKRVIARCHSVEDLRQAARRKLPRAVFDYVDGGADAENTVAANRAAFEQWAFQPQILHDVSAPDLSVELFGRRLTAPLGLAPTGYTRMINPVGEIGVASASAPTGLPYGLSTVGSTSIEDLAATGHPRLWFQLYALRDRGLTRSLVERAAGCRLRGAGGVGRHPRGREPRPGRAQRADHPASAEGADRARHRPAPGLLDDHAAQPDAQLSQRGAESRPESGWPSGRSAAPR